MSDVTPSRGLVAFWTTRWPPIDLPETAMSTSQPAARTAMHSAAQPGHARKRLLRWTVLTLLLMLAAVAVGRA